MNPYTKLAFFEVMTCFAVLVPYFLLWINKVRRESTRLSIFFRYRETGVIEAAVACLIGIILLSMHVAFGAGIIMAWSRYHAAIVAEMVRHDVLVMLLLLLLLLLFVFLYKVSPCCYRLPKEAALMRLSGAQVTSWTPQVTSWTPLSPPSLSAFTAYFSSFSARDLPWYVCVCVCVCGRCAQHMPDPTYVLQFVWHVMCTLAFPMSLYASFAFAVI